MKKNRFFLLNLVAALLLCVGLLFAQNAQAQQSKLTCDDMSYYLLVAEKMHYRKLNNPLFRSELIQKFREVIIQFFNSSERLITHDQLSKISTQLFESKNNYKAICLVAKQAFLTIQDRFFQDSLQSHDDKLKVFFESILDDLLRSLDSRSYFIPESKNRQNKAAALLGIGNQYGFKTRGLTHYTVLGPYEIIQIISGSPAEKAGIELGDIITHIDDQPTRDMDFIKIYGLLRENKPHLRFTIQRAQRAFIKQLSGDIFYVPTVSSQFLDFKKKIAYFKIHVFTRKTGPEFSLQIQKLRSVIDSDFAGIVLDLRNNRGGTHQGEIDLIDALIDQGVVSLNHISMGETLPSYADTAGSLSSAPIIILVNQKSASASEAAIAALRDYNRAIIIGNHTVGKGTDQWHIDFNSDLFRDLKSLLRLKPKPKDSYDGSLVLTTGVFYSPAGLTHQSVGISPDIEVWNQEERERLAEIRRRFPHLKLYESEYGSHSIQVEPIEVDFSPRYGFRSSALYNIENNFSLSSELTEFEKRDVQLTTAKQFFDMYLRDKRKLNRNLKVLRLYESPEYKLQILNDLYGQKNMNKVRISFYKREIISSYWGFVKDTQDVRIYQQEVILSKPYVTVSLENTAVASYFRENPEGYLNVIIHSEDEDFTTYSTAIMLER